MTLSLERKPAVAEIHVRDTGAGIEPELLHGLFTPFTQARQTLARTEGGLGLGLAFVKGLVELHGGSVTAESAGTGRGTEVTVSLPLLASAKTAQDPGASSPARSQPRRVLVVDDNHDAAESLADLLRTLGHEVEVAYDGPTAVERARAGTPDVVLCDIGLPGMSGYDVARALRADGAGGGNGVKLVALSGYAQPEDVKLAVEAGFDVHVAKPAELAVLERLLE